MQPHTHKHTHNLKSDKLLHLFGGGFKLVSFLLRNFLDKPVSETDSVSDSCDYLKPYFKHISNENPSKQYELSVFF